MPAAASVRQQEHAACAWLRKQSIQQVVDEELRQAAPDLARGFGRCGLLLRACGGLPAGLDGHHLGSMLGVHACAGRLEGDFVAAFDRLPLASGSLALVYSLHALECVDDRAALIDELARVLDPGGMAMFHVFNPVGLFRVRWAATGLPPLPAFRLAGLIRSAGLEVRSCRALGVCWRAPRGSTAAAPRSPGLLRSSYLMIARRHEAGLVPPRPERVRRRPIALGTRAHG